MSTLWPANADVSTAWAARTWSDLAALPGKDRMLVVLPVHGFADHGMGLPLDAEAVLGSALLGAGLTSSGLESRTLVLPAFSLGVAPYAHTRFGTDIETTLDAIDEIAAGVKAAGFVRLVFFNTSPWNGELVATAALDARVALGLRTYVVATAGIGLGFHPAEPSRPRTQAVVARLLGRAPSPSPAPADVRDADFRPGRFDQPPPATPDLSLDGASLFVSAASRLADLLAEIAAHESSGPENAVRPSAVFPERPRPRARTLAGLTAAELDALPDKDRALVIIPTGAVEQHGHHLPLGTDSLLGEIWLDRTLPRLPASAPVYIAPALVYGKSNEHAGFPGTITLSARTLRRQLVALASGLHARGFRRIAVLNTHGGNSAVLVATLRELQTAPGLRAGMLSGYYRPSQSPQEAAFGFHAGEWETSLLLAAAPGLVRMDRAVCEYPSRIDAPGSLRPEKSAAVHAWTAADLSKSGVMGDATLATAEKGARWLDEASAALALRIEALLGPS